MYNLASIRVFTDGGSRGNPGEAATGVYIEDMDGIEIKSFGNRLGIATNNVAEYTAIVEALEWIHKSINEFEVLEKIYFFMDSNLAVNQLNGLYKIKNANIRNLIFEVKKLESSIGLEITYTHVRRENNKDADRMVNFALDNKI